MQGGSWRGGGRSLSRHDPLGWANVRGGLPGRDGLRARDLMHRRLYWCQSVDGSGIKHRVNVAQFGDVVCSELTSVRAGRRLFSSVAGGKGRKVSIGDVANVFDHPKELSKVPVGYDRAFGSAVCQEVLHHLRWMLQKDILGQDMFLLGPPGHMRRHLALRYAEMTQREVEFVSLTRDTSEADLKQRREIKNGSVEYVNQAPVRAALEGRLLILDGIEKAERNVLPTLNNLLENREMQLDDGRFLMRASRYDLLSEEETSRDHLVRVNPNFRVLALGLPVPPYRGKTLDPPLRSRFQVRVVEPLGASDLWPDLVHAVSMVDPGVSGNPKDNAKVLALATASSALNAGGLRGANDNKSVSLPPFPENALPSLSQLVHLFQQDQIGMFLNRAFPYFGNMPLGKDQSGFRDTAQIFLGQRSKELVGGGTELDANTVYRLSGVEADGNYTFASENDKVTLQGVVGTRFLNDPTYKHVSKSGFHPISVHEALISGMAQDHCVDRDIMIVGEPGSGKSRVAEEFASRLGYNVQLFSLYRDISARDLLQRRTTDSQGNTGWDYSPLVRAAVNGDVCILDGVSNVDPDTFAVIQRLIVDREADLFDGKCLRMKRTDQEMADNEIEIHPSFRVVALATCSKDGSRSESQWLTPELLSMFSVHYLKQLDPYEQQLVIRKVVPSIPSSCSETLLNFTKELLEVKSIAPSKSKKKRMKETSGIGVSRAASIGLRPLSIRQAIRIARRQYDPKKGDILLDRERIRNILLAHFLPASQRRALEELMNEVGIPPETSSDQVTRTDIKIEASRDVLKIDNVEVPVTAPSCPELVPSPLFFEIAKHKRILRDVLEDVVSGERHILLIGNQGVGKNKIADRLLQMMRKEREYIQLHRDSTVGSLTLSPSLKDGIVVWDDSPLVRAAVHGRTLMIDEVDKAPLEVVSVLKSLVEDDEMLLADGRRLVNPDRYAMLQNSGSAHDKLVPIHEKFSIIVLANRPGFPFLGNNFFRESGDIFSSHVISNPDTESELELLSAYAPSVDTSILRLLVDAFASLRELVDQGVLVYPYSTREAVAVARHLETFPDDGLVDTLENVLGFDTFDPQLVQTIVDVFQRHGIPLAAERFTRNNQNPSTSRELAINVAESKPLGEFIHTEEWINPTKTK